MPDAVYHDVICRISNLAIVTIHGDALSITAGAWPGGISLEAIEGVPLAETDVAIYVNRDGSGVTISNAHVPFGNSSPDFIERLAWKEDGAWQVMRMVPDAYHV